VEDKIANFFSIQMIYTMISFIIGHALAWYCHNGQLVWEFWDNRPFLSNFVFGIPAGVAFWYGTKFCMEASGELWTTRFMVFALSYVTFPLMTWWYLNESMFTLKTGICTFLAFLILLIQITLK